MKQVIYLSGSRGMVGKNILDHIDSKNYKILSTVDKKVKADYCKGVTLYRTLAYRPKWTHAGLIDTLFESNQKLRSMIQLRDGKIAAYKDELDSLRKKLKTIIN